MATYWISYPGKKFYLPQACNATLEGLRWHYLSDVELIVYGSSSIRGCRRYYEHMSHLLLSWNMQECPWRENEEGISGAYRVAQMS